MNEFERRLLEVTQNHNDVVSLARSAGPAPLVEHFGYTFKMGALGGSIPDAGLTALKPILSDAWFVLQYVSSCVVHDPGGAFPDFQWCVDSGQVQLQLTDTGSGEILFSQPLSAGVLTGTISRAQTGTPMLLPIPRLIAPATIIKADITPLGGAAAAGVEWFYLALGGSRIAATS